MSSNSAWIYSGPNSGKVIVYHFDTVDPAVTDDADSGYIATSRWINTDTQDEWVCLDNSVGAAVWKPTTTGGGGGGGSVSYGPATSLVVGGGNVNGVLTTVSRSDHKHALPAFGTTAGTFAEGNDSRLSDSRSPTAHATTHLPAGSDPLSTAIASSIQPDDAAAIGVANSFSRSDHKHGIVAAAPGSISPDDAAVEGVAVSFSRSDHQHAIVTDVPGTIQPDDAASEGVAASFARSDHQHAIVAAAPGTISPDDSANEGVATSFARSDHRHAITAAAPGTISPDDAASEGVASFFARSDHQHAITTDVPGTIQPDDSASEGSAGSFARSDHRHAIVAATAGAATPGDTAIEGTATSFARSDHRHSLPAFGTTAGTFAEGNDSRFTNVARIWDARAIPSGLHADSDEFDDNSVDASWNDFDHGSWVTTTEESPTNALVHTGTASASSRAAGKYKAIPSNEFQFISQVFIDGAAGGTGSSNAWSVGLAVFVNASNSASSFRSVELVNNNPDTSSICTLNQRTWTNYTTPGSPLFRNTMATMVWLRLRVLVSGGNTTVGHDWSTDGESWSQIGATTALIGAVVAHYGLIMNSNVNGNVIRVYHKHFRVWSGAGASAFNYTKNGNYLGS